MYCTWIKFYFTFHGISIFSRQHDFILPVKEAVTPEKNCTCERCVFVDAYVGVRMWVHDIVSIMPVCTYMYMYMIRSGRR